MPNIVYNQIKDYRIYQAGTQNPGAYFVLSEGIGLPKSIKLNDALTNTNYTGVFIFSNPPLACETPNAILNLADKALASIKSTAYSAKGMVWVKSDNISAICPLKDDGSSLSGSFYFDIYPLPNKLEFSAQNGLQVYLNNETALAFKAPLNSGSFSFSTRVIGNIHDASIGFTDENAGVLIFCADISFSDFINDNSPDFSPGFTFVYGDDRQIMLPFINSSGDKTFSFQFYLNPCDIAGSKMLFTRQASFKTYYKTIYNEEVVLNTLINNSGFGFFVPQIKGNTFVSVPIGDYSVNSDVKLMCGLSGVEFIKIKKDGILSFVPHQPAYADCFPVKSLTIDDFVNPQGKDLFNNTYLVSWVSINAPYFSQPTESPYYGGTASLLTNAETATSINGLTFPCAPYFGFKGDVPVMEQFERQLVSVKRSNVINNHTVKQIKSSSPTVKNIATPSGYLVGVDTNGNWNNINLAYSGSGILGFENPGSYLIQCFKTSGMFLVAADSTNIGTFNNSASLPGGWSFKFDIGGDCHYNDYANIMIVKSGKGKIYDPGNVSNSLVANPSFWIMRDEFSSPNHKQEQQTNLSNWLISYFKDISAQTSGYFENIKSIAGDENWQGILFLNVSLSSLPEELQCLTAGLPQNTLLSLHHFGARVTPLKSSVVGPVNDGYSSFFGLIYYDSSDNAPVHTGGDYDFTLLELKALFENSRLSQFESSAQLFVNKLFGQNPDVSGLVLLKGSVQNNNGTPCFKLVSSSSNVFSFSNPPFTQISIDGAEMSTLKTGDYVFSLNGKIMTAKQDIDLYSFDKLVFNGYKLKLYAGSFTLDFSEITFDPKNSVERSGSLCADFSLSLKNMVNYAKDTTPESLGYSPVVIDNFTNDVFSGDWSGLCFNAVLGSLGKLSTASYLNASILLAWDGSGHNYAGIALPRFASFQNIIDASLSQARIMLNKKGRIVLALTGISLKVLGLLKLPPNGSISAYLFGESKQQNGTGWIALYKKEAE